MIQHKPNTVIIFLDVDGVLNDKCSDYVEVTGDSNEKWISTKGEYYLEENYLDKDLLNNLSNFVFRAKMNGYDPQMVLSSSWRVNEKLTDYLLFELSQHKIKCNDQDDEELSLLSFLHNYNDGADVLSQQAPWKTPNLLIAGSEGRLLEINMWLRAYREQYDIRYYELLYIIFDDLDLLYTDTGKRNESLQEINFVQTVNRISSQKVEGKIGLTLLRVREGIEKIKDQDEKRKYRECSTGPFTNVEWVLLQEHPKFQPYLHTLKHETCPDVLRNAAYEYLKKNDNGKKINTTSKNTCQIL